MRCVLRGPIVIVFLMFVLLLVVKLSIWVVFRSLVMMMVMVMAILIGA